VARPRAFFFRARGTFLTQFRIYLVGIEGRRAAGAPRRPGVRVTSEGTLLMLASTAAGRPPADPTWAELESIIQRFEEAWHEGERPAIDDYLPTEAARRRPALIELVHADLEYRLKAGEDVRVEGYLRRYPELESDPQEILELIDREYELRRRQGTPLAPDEYLTRFPQYRDVLETRLRSPQADTAQASTAEHQPARPRRASLLNAPPPEVPGYEVLKELGRGGMGVVYQARQVALNRLVALKMIPPGSAAEPAQVRRLRREAEAVARLGHPNILQVHEVGEVQGRPFLALEFVEGGSLDRRLQDGPLPPAAAAQLAETLARAVEAAHQRGILHRDLKPANVLLAPSERPEAVALDPAEAPRYEPKVADFGLAKRLDEEGHTHTGAILGTPSYMAPEQACGLTRDLTPAADVYALGCILYEMLTGRPPFRGPTSLDTLDQVRSQEPVPPRRLQPQVPRGLETICLKCLQKPPGQRYASAGALADDLRRFRTGEPIRARPAPAWERLLLWARRRPYAAALWGVVAAALVGAAGALAGHYADLQAQLTLARGDERREQQARQAAEEQARLVTRRAEIAQALEQGRSAVKGEDWEAADRHAAAALAGARDDPALADLRAAAEELRHEVAAYRQARADRREFLRLLDEALFHATLLTGLDTAANREITGDTARRGLALFGVGPEAESGQPGRPSLRRYFTDAEQKEIIEGCYQLLLVWAEAAAAPQPGSDPRAQAAEALALLDRAARFRLPTQAYHRRRARYLAQAGDESGAAAERARAEALAPAGALDQFLMGEDRYQQGRVAEAAGDFQRALQREPDHFWARYFLAVCYLKQPHPQPELARDNLTATLARRPDFAWGYLLRGFAHVKLGEFPAADADFRQVAACRPDKIARYGLLLNRGYLRLRQAQAAEAAAAVLEMGTLLPAVSVSTGSALAAWHQRQEYLTAAAADFRQAIDLRPKEYQGYVNLAQVYRQQQQAGEALAQLDRAVALVPGLAAPYRERAQVQAERQDLAAALADLDRAVALEPAGSPYRAADLVQKARLLRRAGRCEEAASACAAALHVRPGYAEALLLRGEALLHLGRSPEALRCLDEYGGAGKATAEFYRLRGRARAKTADHAGAAEDYGRALTLAPDAPTHVTRGWIYLLALHAPEPALADFEEALRIDPANGDAHAGRGNALVELGRVAEGVAAAEQAIHGGTPSPRLLCNAARAFALALRRAPRRQYQERVYELLRQALEATSAPERQAFWRTAVRPDPAFGPLLSLPGFRQLEE
jgi:serine/threonine protein kinase/tetratricopeptide (TPR) repeat protein